MKKPMTSNELYHYHNGIPKRLKTLIRQSGMSQNRYAKSLGIYQQNISRYLQGQSPHAEFLIRLSEIQGINLNWFLTGSGQQHRS